MSYLVLNVQILEKNIKHFRNFSELQRVINIFYLFISSIFFLILVITTYVEPFITYYSLKLTERKTITGKKPNYKINAFIVPLRISNAMTTPPYYF